jgi:hypothetical protein
MVQGQRDLFTPRPPAIVETARQHTSKFSSDFLNWLPNNLHVWNAFVHEAERVIARGFKHYSARTIIHVLRHHSALEEAGGEWKLNNNYSPYLARLFDIVYPQHAGLWEYRETKKVTAERGTPLASCHAEM